MHNILFNKNKSSFINKLLRSNNMHNLIVDKIKLKSKINDHFEDLHMNKMKRIIVFLVMLITKKV